MYTKRDMTESVKNLMFLRPYGSHLESIEGQLWLKWRWPTYITVKPYQKRKWSNIFKLKDKWLKTLNIEHISPNGGHLEICPRSNLVKMTHIHPSTDIAKMKMIKCIRNEIWPKTLATKHILALMAAILKFVQGQILSKWPTCTHQQAY